MANINLLAINRTTQDSTIINPDSDASTGLKISTWDAPAGEEAYGLQVGLPQVTGGASNAYSIYSEGPMSFKDSSGTGKIILSTVGSPTSNTSYTLSLPRQTSTLATIDDVVAARNGLDVHDSARVATTAAVPKVTAYDGEVLNAGVPLTSSSYNTTYAGSIFKGAGHNGATQPEASFRAATGLTINVATITASGGINTYTIPSSGSNYKSAAATKGQLEIGGNAPNTATETEYAVTATNGSEWIVGLAAGAGLYSAKVTYILPRGLGDFTTQADAFDETGGLSFANFAVTILGSAFTSGSGSNGANDLTFKMLAMPTVVRVESPSPTGTPAYFWVKKHVNTTTYAVESLHLIHAGSGFTTGTYSTVVTNGLVSGYKTGTSLTLSSILGTMVANDPFIVRRVWFVKGGYSTSSTATLGTPYYPRTNTGLGMYVSYAVVNGAATSMTLTKPGSGYTTNVQSDPDAPYPIQIGISTGKMNFTLDLPTGRCGVTATIPISGGIPGIATTFTGIGGTAPTVSGNDYRTFSNVQCYTKTNTTPNTDGKFTIYTTAGSAANGASYNSTNTKIFVITPPSDLYEVGTPTAIKIPGTALGGFSPTNDLSFSYVRTSNQPITIGTGGAYVPTMTSAEISVSPDQDAPVAWYMKNPIEDTVYQILTELSTTGTPDIGARYFTQTSQVWTDVSDADPFVLYSKSTVIGSGLKLSANSSAVTIAAGGKGDWYRVGDRIYLGLSGTGTYVTVDAVDDFRGIGKGPVLTITAPSGAIPAASSLPGGLYNAVFLTSGPDTNPNSYGTTGLPTGASSSFPVPTEYATNVSTLSMMSGYRSYVYSVPNSSQNSRFMSADGGHCSRILATRTTSLTDIRALNNYHVWKWGQYSPYTYSFYNLGTAVATHGFATQMTTLTYGFIKPVGPAKIDDITILEGTRVLVKNQDEKKFNGIYTTSYAKRSPYVFMLYRSTDFDSTTAVLTAPNGEVNPNAFVFVEEGTINKDTGWTCTTDAPITLGSSEIIWAKFTGASGIAEDQGVVGWTGTHTFSKWGTLVDDPNPVGKFTYFGDGTNWILPTRSTSQAIYSLELHSDSVLKLSANTPTATTRMNLGSNGVDNIFGSTTNGFEMKFIRTKSGDADTYLAVSDGDTLGKLSFKGYTGTLVANTLEAASIIATAKGAVGATLLGGSLSFLTTPSIASTASQERLRIDDAGFVTIYGVSGNVNSTNGIANLLTNVTTGSVNLFTSVTKNEDGINIGGAGSQVTIGTTSGNSSLNIKGSTTSGTATLTTNAATGYLFNTSATSISLGGSATAITMGSSLGNGLPSGVTVGGVLGTGGVVTINNPTVTMANTAGTSPTTFNMNGSANLRELIIETSTIDSTASIFNGTLIAAGKLFGRTTAISIGSAKIPGTTINPQTVGIGGTTVNAVPLVAPTVSVTSGGSTSYYYAYTAVYNDGSESIASPVTASSALSSTTPNNSVTITNIANAVSYNLYRLTSATATTGQKIAVTATPLPVTTTVVADTNLPVASNLLVTVPAQHSSVIGQSSYQLGFSANASTTRGRFSLASGGFAANATPTVPIAGSSQMSTYVLSAYTYALNQPVTMTTDWVGTAGTAPTLLNQIIIKPNSTYAFSILVSISASGDATQGSMGTAGATIITEGVISRLTGVTTIQGGSVISRCQSNLFAALGCNTTNAPSITLVDNDNNGIFAIQAKSNTGSTLGSPSARSLRWTAVVTMSECG